MEKKPRNPNEKILSKGLIIKSVLQGIFIFAASFGSYWFMLSKGSQADLARSMGLTVIMLANLFLVQVNSSDNDFVYISLKMTGKDRFMRFISMLTVLLILVILYTPLNSFLKLAPLSAAQLLAACFIAAASVFWYEFVKLVKKKKCS
ncbi:hypothetical protein SDC9_205138 [bioreactor metagenome]|uniref:Cation-transporting P-type ATPase C-terminal domain-containing protein n=1 Tax=bioreactor metagenome TaxID=1076179 RepID=A0A645JAF2_9ZZZZ